ncbi:MAG: 4Fe-4S binding protein, partial [Actinomycetia bacterium]|nr:4Fe-4S binding protein [Actinomycetes bacterium]
RSMCAAADGCRACADICPQGAYSWQAGKITFNKDICEPCGRCVTGCPTAAISNPAATPQMLEAQVRSHISQTSGAAGIRFVCSRGDLPQEAGWLDVEVPCTSMVPGTWLLACIAMGAGGAALVTCTGSGCPLRLDEHALASIEFARTILTSCDLAPDAVGTGRGEPLGPVASIDLADPFAVGGAASVLLALASVTGTSLDVVHDASPVGVVEINDTACTLCAQCATTCPTNALQNAYDGESIAITFDAAACVNCRQCLAACPELARGAIAVVSRANTAGLGAGRQTLNEGVVLMCEICGKPIAPDTMMNRISDILGEEFEATMRYLSGRCLDCRGQG